MKTIDRRPLLFCTFVILCSLCSAQVTKDNFPAEKIDQYMQDYFNKAPFPGISVVFSNREGEIWSKGYGLEQIDKPVPMTASSSGAIGSITKSFTALAVMRLWERGEIELDSPVTKYLSWFRTADKENSDKITVRMLMQNASGIHTGDGQYMEDANDDPEAMEKLVRSLAGIRTVREPGVSFEYANENWIILGVVIEKITGMRYADFMDKEIFQPLGMNRTTTDLHTLDEIGALKGHYLGVEKAFPAKRLYWTAVTPAGSLLHSSASDLAKYMALYLSEGTLPNGEQFVSKNTIKMMTTGYLPLPGLSADMGGNGKDDYYGFGWFITEADNRILVQHGGNAVTQSSMMTMDFNSGIGVSILFNSEFYNQGFTRDTRLTLTNNLLHLALNEPLSAYGRPLIPDPNYADPPVEVTAELLTGIPGTYKNSKGDTAVVRAEKGQILAHIYEFPTQLEVKILPTIGNRYIAVNAEMSLPGFFSRNQEGIITVFNCEGVSYFRVPDSSSASVVKDEDNAFFFTNPGSSLIWNVKKGSVSAEVAGGTINVSILSNGDNVQNYREEGWIEDSVEGRIWMEQTVFSSDDRAIFTAVLPGKFKVTLETNTMKLTALASGYIPVLLKTIQTHDANMDIQQ